jgi:aminotransferase
LKCQLPRGSFYAFPCVSELGYSSKDFAVGLLDEQNVACVPGTAFGPSGQGFVRCCFATSTKQLELAMERIKRFVQKN